MGYVGIVLHGICNDRGAATVNADLNSGVSSVCREHLKAGQLARSCSEGARIASVARVHSSCVLMCFALWQLIVDLSVACCSSSGVSSDYALHFDVANFITLNSNECACMNMPLG